MKRFFLAAALLAVAGCGDGAGNPVSARATQPDLAVGPSSPELIIFTTQQPASFLAASPGWEVATRFKASEPGRIVGFRFWRAPGETGTNRGRLWTNAGTLLKTATFPSGGSGWQTVRFSNHVRIPANAYYRVSVNTNTEQAKTFGSAPFTLTNGSLTGDLSYYGQPTGSMPTTSSYSLYFVDVIFIPDGPLPNLYVASITRGTNQAGEETVSIRVCNNGTASAGASTLRMDHNAGLVADVQDVPTPGLAVSACADLTPDVYAGGNGVPHSYHVWADDYDVLYESNEADNQAVLE